MFLKPSNGSSKGLHNPRVLEFRGTKYYWKSRCKLLYHSGFRVGVLEGQGLSRFIIGIARLLYMLYMY